MFSYITAIHITDDGRLLATFIYYSANPQFILQMMEDCSLLSFTILPIHGKHLKG